MTSKQKKRSNITLLILLIVLLSGYFMIDQWTNNKQSASLTTTLVPENIDPSHISKIKISKEGVDTITLIREQDSWVVSDGTITVPAQDNSFESILSSIQQIEPDRLVSTKPEQWPQYLVDEQNGTYLDIYEGKDMVLALVLGKFSIDPQTNKYHTFVRASKANEVYRVDDFFAIGIAPQLSNYRYNTLLAITDSVAEIVVKTPSDKFTLKYTDEKWNINEQPVDSIRMAEYLSSIKSVQEFEFYDQRTELVSPTHSITFTLRDKKSVTLHAQMDPDKEEGWITTSTQARNTLYSTTTTYESLFKTTSYFFGEGDK